MYNLSAIYIGTIKIQMQLKPNDGAMFLRWPGKEQITELSVDIYFCMVEQYESIYLP